MYIYNIVCRSLLCVLLCLFGATLSAQTIIDLDNKGKVRGKTIYDYKSESDVARRERNDSIEYADHLVRAFNALHADSLEEARKQFRAAISTRPDAPGNYIIRHNLGRIALAQGRYDEAVKLLTQVLKEQPDNPEVRADRANAALSSGNAAMAIDDCNVLLQRTLVDERRAQVFFMRAAAQMQLRNVLLHRRLTHDCRAELVYLRAAAQIHRPTPPAARADLETVLKLTPDNENAALLLLMTLRDEGRKQEALARLNDFVAQHPKNADAYAL
ncbi:MAG: tetratricopeptide repeat protein, partial [Bacteroidales bacterium]